MQPFYCYLSALASSISEKTSTSLSLFIFLISIYFPSTTPEDVLMIAKQQPHSSDLSHHPVGYCFVWNVLSINGKRTVYLSTAQGFPNDFGGKALARE
jgi:hypothetical protein